jgi:hypothetical protein
VDKYALIGSDSALVLAVADFEAESERNFARAAGLPAGYDSPDWPKLPVIRPTPPSSPVDLASRLRQIMKSNERLRREGAMH